MRKSVVIIAVFLFSVSMFAGVTKSEFVGGIKYHFISGGVGELSKYGVPSGTNQLNHINFPYVDYKIEMMLGSLFKIYIHPSIGYKLLKGEIDGTSPEGYDRYATEFYLKVKPMLKFYLPKQIFKMDGFFAKGGLSITSESISPHNVNPAPAEHTKAIDGFLSLGFDNRKIDQHILTPWDMFEQGWAAYATFDEYFFHSSVSTEDPEVIMDQLPRYFGIVGCYSHLVKKENMMVKMMLDYKYQVNPDCMGGGHKDTTVDLSLLFAYDVIKQIHASANFGFRVEELEMTDAAGNGNYNYLVFGVNGHFYPLSIFDLYGGFELNMDLTSEDADPGYKYELGGALIFK